MPSIKVRPPVYNKPEPVFWLHFEDRFMCLIIFIELLNMRIIFGIAKGMGKKVIMKIYEVSNGGV